MLLHGSEGAWGGGATGTRYYSPPMASWRSLMATQAAVWSVEMTKCLEKRLREHGRSPEVHYYEDEGHIPTQQRWVE